jgi:hypothetical protein
MTFTAAMLAGEGTMIKGVETDAFPGKIDQLYANLIMRNYSSRWMHFPCNRKGVMETSVSNGKSLTKLLLCGVLHVPSMGLTIVSVGCLDEAGYGIFLRGNACHIYNISKTIIGQIPPATNRLYWVEHGDTMFHWTDLLPLEELHCKLGHIAPKAVKRLVKEGIIEGVELDGYSFSRRRATPSTPTRILKPGSRPIVTQKIKHLWSDHGGEFTSDEFTAHLHSEGREQHLTMHNTPEHNSIADALNCPLLEWVWAMLHQIMFSEFLWGEAILHVTYLKNQTATFILGDKTPYEVLTSKKPNISNLPQWGTGVWVHDPTGSKLAGRW